MKKKALTLAAVLLFPLIAHANVIALEANPNSGTYLDDTTITLNLTATPQNNENAVSINLLADGLTILNYTPPSDSEWIGSTGDCENNQKYTAKSVCSSLAKPNAIKTGESLGTVTLKVKGKVQGKLIRTEENAYSNGKTLRKNVGQLVVFNEAFPPEVKSTNGNNSAPVVNNTDTNSTTSNNGNAIGVQNALPFVIGGIIVLVLVITAVLIMKKGNKAKITEVSNNTISSQVPVQPVAPTQAPDNRNNPF